MSERLTLPRRVVIGMLRGYKKFISPLLPPACRYEPSCSLYMMEAVELHGVLRGGWLGTLRLLRCHPFAKGGFDPPPLPRTSPTGHATPDATAAGGRAYPNQSDEGMTG